MTKTSKKADAASSDLLIAKFAGRKEIGTILATIFIAYCAVTFQSFASEYWLRLGDKALDLSMWIGDSTDFTFSFTIAFLYILVVTVGLQSTFWLWLSAVVKLVPNLIHAQGFLEKLSESESEALRYDLMRRTLTLLGILVVMGYPWFLGFWTDIYSQYGGIMGSPETVLDFDLRMATMTATTMGKLMNSIVWVMSVALAVLPEAFMSLPGVIISVGGPTLYEQAVAKYAAPTSTEAASAASAS